MYIMKQLSLLVASAAGLLLTSCQSAPPADQPQGTASPEIVNAIAASNARYFQAFVKGDSTTLLDCYTPDACLMPPNAPALCGPQAVGAFFRVSYQQLGIRNGKFTTQHVWSSGGSYATEQGLYELRDAQDHVLDNGKYLVLWQKTASGWKMLRDSFNSVNPPAPATAATK
jgi:ketosteroid isomerase-like protein